MPRPTIERPAAEPTSSRQHERYQNILRAARTLTTEKGEDAVQMAEVAQQAGVALNTLYRYFPSKAHLYVAVLEQEIAQLSGRFSPQTVTTDEQAADNVMEFILAAGEAMFSRPHLARAVMNANVASAASGGQSAAKTDQALEDALMSMLGISERTEDDVRMAYMIMVSWSGVQVAILNGRLDPAEFEPRVRLAVEQLVKVRSNR